MAAMRRPALPERRRLRIFKAREEIHPGPRRFPMSTQVSTAVSGRPLLARIGGWLRGMAEIAADVSVGMRCAREAERLSALSDAELARRGLARDRIIEHAFRDFMST
jgi:hypothetical protein